MTHPERPDRSPAIAELLDDAYVAPVGVETAARHLWAIHAEANRVAAAQVAAVEPVSPASRRVPRAAVPVLALVMAMSSSGMALAASQSSLPGDVLYPVKRGTEQAQLVFARNPEARAQLQLSFARTRLEEIRQIAATRPQHVPALVAAINVTLSAVQLEAPEDSERVRREIDAEIASLDLPATTTQAATTSAPTSTAATALQGTATPTEAPTEGGATATAAATSATVDPSAEPTPSGSEGEVATDEPTATDGTDIPSDGEPSTSPTPTTSPSPTTSTSPTTTTSPTPTTSPSDGPVVTSRPHPGDTPDGTSRTEEPEPAPEPSSSEPTEEPTGDGHFSRPGS